MKYRIKATKEIVELRTWKRDDGAIKLVDKYGKMGFWPDEVEPAEQLGWHPASELPPLDEKGYSDDLIVICGTCNTFFDLPRWSQVVEGVWGDSSVKWWCYPPKED